MLSRRTIKSFLVAFLLIVITIVVYKAISTPKAADVRTSSPSPRLVTATPVSYSTHTIFIEGNGLLKAKHQLTLLSEVSGDVLLSPVFEEGQFVATNDPIIAIDSREIDLTIASGKSDFLRQITTALPNVDIEFNNRMPVWMAFMNQVRFDAPLPDLPEIDDPRERLFFSSNGILSAYFSLKELEIRREKYVIRAPFFGTVVDAQVDAGDVVVNGQPMGRFITTGDYEMSVSVRLDDMPFIAIGSPVHLESDGLSAKSWKGQVEHINTALNPSTQLLSVRISVNDHSLSEGQYLSAKIQSIDITDVMSIDRSLLIDDKALVYTIDNGVLKHAPIQIIYRSFDTVLFRGLPSDTLILSQSISGAFEGMPVQQQR